MPVETELHQAVVEQVMRVCGDEYFALLAHDAGDHHALCAAVGQLLGATSVPLPLGSPLMTLSGHGTLDPQWRRACPPRAESLWSQLEFYRTLGYAVEDADPLAELCLARDRELEETARVE